MESFNTPTPQKLSAEELQKKMLDLQEKINSAQKEKEVVPEVAEVEIPEKPAVENVGEKVEELETNYNEGKQIETEKAELTANIERTQSELSKFEDLMKQAETLGIAVESNKPFLTAFQTEKDKLADLEQKQSELMGRAKEIANNPDVMNKIRDEADTENIEKIEKEKQLKESLDVARRNIYFSVTEAIDEKIQSNNFKFIQTYDWARSMDYSRNMDYQDFVKKIDSAVLDTLKTSNSLEDFKQNIKIDSFVDNEIIKVASEDKYVNEYFELKANAQENK